MLPCIWVFEFKRAPREFHTALTAAKYRAGGEAPIEHLFRGCKVLIPDADTNNMLMRACSHLQLIGVSMFSRTGMQSPKHVFLDNLKPWYVIAPTPAVPLMFDHLRKIEGNAALRVVVKRLGHFCVRLDALTN